MKFKEWLMMHFCNTADSLQEQMKKIGKNQQELMMKQSELTEQVKNLTAQVQKSRAEIQAAIDAATSTVAGLQQRIDDLISNGKVVDQELVDAVAELKTNVQAIDDLNPDSAEPIPTDPVPPTDTATDAAGTDTLNT